LEVLGIDIGGSGIKGAPVSVSTGEQTAERFRVDTPIPATPEAVAEGVAEVARHFEFNGPIGCTFPAVVQHGIVYTAANVDDTWIGVDAVTLFERTTGCPVRVLNDADAAGVAEMTFGAGKNRKDVVMMLTFGTGIGSAIFVNGELLPNTELGHLQIRGMDAEHRAAARIRNEEGLSWKKWAKRVDEYLGYLEFYFSPDLFIIGGGVSKKQHKFFPYLTTRAEIVPAQLLNEAGIIGAAMAARDLVAG
jgi:polyphosphate glucokinase